MKVFIPSSTRKNRPRYNGNGIKSSHYSSQIFMNINFSSLYKIEFDFDHQLSSVVTIHVIKNKSVIQWK